MNSYEYYGYVIGFETYSTDSLKIQITNKNTLKVYQKIIYQHDLTTKSINKFKTMFEKAIRSEPNYTIGFDDNFSQIDLDLIYSSDILDIREFIQIPNISVDPIQMLSMENSKLKTEISELKNKLNTPVCIGFETSPDDLIEYFYYSPNTEEIIIEEKPNYRYEFFPNMGIHFKNLKRISGNLIVSLSIEITSKYWFNDTVEEIMGEIKLKLGCGCGRGHKHGYYNIQRPEFIVFPKLKKIILDFTMEYYKNFCGNCKYPYCQNKILQILKYSKLVKIQIKNPPPPNPSDGYYVNEKSSYDFLIKFISENKNIIQII